MAAEKKHHGKILLSAARIKNRVKCLAERISKDYRNKDLTMVAVLKGSVIFFADLLRRLKIHCNVEFVSVSSYKGAKSSGKVKITADLNENPAGKDILLVEDIADSGRTIYHLSKYLKKKNPKSVRTCVLLNKRGARKVPVKIDYSGFYVPDRFLVGYGLDYNEEYRGLPFIGVLDVKK